ncbi:hypothetical protein MTP99_001413 [Tenebrio molitor]|nr:hypothetical protein MTP99_001413 [Tenebrio molitor]
MRRRDAAIFFNFPVVPVVNLCNRPDPAENTNVKDPPVSITIGGAASPRLFARSGGTPIGNIAAQNQNQWDSNSLRCYGCQRLAKLLHSVER